MKFLCWLRCRVPKSSALNRVSVLVVSLGCRVKWLKCCIGGLFYNGFQGLQGFRKSGCRNNFRRQVLLPNADRVSGFAFRLFKRWLPPSTAHRAQTRVRSHSHGHPRYRLEPPPLRCSDVRAGIMRTIRIGFWCMLLHQCI